MPTVCPVPSVLAGKLYIAASSFGKNAVTAPGVWKAAAGVASAAAFMPAAAAGRRIAPQRNIGQTTWRLSRPNTPTTIPLSSSGIMIVPCRPRYHVSSGRRCVRSSTWNAFENAAVVPSRMTVRSAGRTDLTASPKCLANPSTTLTSSGSAPCLAAYSACDMCRPGLGGPGGSGVRRRTRTETWNVSSPGVGSPTLAPGAGAFSLPGSPTHFENDSLAMVASLGCSTTNRIEMLLAKASY